MGNLRKSYRRFELKNRDRGIQNLMQWICIGNAIVFVVQYLLKIDIVSLLYFSPVDVMHGQVWRLFSYIFTFACSSGSLFGVLLGAILSILFYYWVGKVLEGVMGTLRFNLYYLCGIVLTDLYLLLIYRIFGWGFPGSVTYLNLSMFLAVASLIPEQKVYVYFILPVKMKWMAWIYLGLCTIDTVAMFVNNWAMFSMIPTDTCIALCLYAFYPWVSLLNYFLFIGKGVKNLKPNFRPRRRKKQQQTWQQPTYRQEERRQEPNPDWASNYRSASGERPYRHKCTVCGRTDTSCPGLEFRYCSRCKGYFCYCVDHINNHTHVE